MDTSKTVLCMQLLQAYRTFLETLAGLEESDTLTHFLYTGAANVYFVRDLDSGQLHHLEVVLYQKRDLRVALNTADNTITACVGTKNVATRSVTPALSKAISNAAEDMWTFMTKVGRTMTPMLVTDSTAVYPYL